MLFEIENLKCSYDPHYQEGHSKVVLEISTLRVPLNKIMFIVGESGIGKSTILETLGMMNNTVVPDAGTVFRFVNPTDGKTTDLVSLWERKNEKRLSKFRLENYSFIFQNTNLMRNFTVYENIAFTRMLQGYPTFQCRQRTRQILEDLGLGHIDPSRKAHELSGGQQRRIAFARAILPDFTVLFGDEPTGNLDGENAVRVMRILSDKLAALENASAVIVSHDMHLANMFADLVVKIRKCYRQKDDEQQSYGVIDETCVFVPDAERKIWTNGSIEVKSEDFEQFLREKQ